MKSIGLIGGMSWESTLLYYRIINREVARRRGGLRSAPMQIASLDFEEIAIRQRRGAWDEMAAILSRSARQLVSAGAACVLICTNTMHRVAPEVRQAIPVPLLHIGEITARAIRQAGMVRVALLGTRFTMEQDFYADVLRGHGIDCLTPDADGRETVHRIIFDELCRGEVRDESRLALLAVIDDLVARGAQGVVLGCTELPLILSPGDRGIPLFDTTRLHALAAVDFALDEPNLGIAA